jgi:hypothetical protein
LVALLNLSALLPGNPDYSSGWGFVGSAVIQAFVVWRLWHGSPLAWLFAFVSAALTVVTLFSMAPGTEIGVILLGALSIAQAGILATRPITTFVTVGSRSGTSPAYRRESWPSVRGTRSRA